MQQRDHRPSRLAPTAIAALVLAVAGVLPAAAATYHVTDLGPMGASAGNGAVADPIDAFERGLLPAPAAAPPGTVAYARNGGGHVVGGAFDEVTGGVQALLVRDGTAVQLGDFANGAGFSIPYGINDRDEVVGMASRGSNLSGQAWTAFRWHDGALQDLGTLPGAPAGAYSAALGINAAGTVVGYATRTADLADAVAFVWQGQQMQDLNTLVDGSGAGWRLQRAARIEADGSIVGAGLRDGQAHAFRATPVQQ